MGGGNLVHKYGIYFELEHYLVVCKCAASGVGFSKLIRLKLESVEIAH